MSPLDTRKLTWAALLSRWVEFARLAVALPDEGQGPVWKKAVPDIIALQAVACALDEIELLASEERALALDKASILIEKHTHRLDALFGPEKHPALARIIAEARRAMNKVSG